MGILAWMNIPQYPTPHVGYLTFTPLFRRSSPGYPQFDGDNLDDTHVGKCGILPFFGYSIGCMGYCGI